MAKKTYTWDEVKRIAKKVYGPEHKWPAVVKKIGGKDHILVSYWDTYWFNDRVKEEKKLYGVQGKTCHQYAEAMAKEARDYGLYARVIRLYPHSRSYREGATAVYVRPMNMKDQWSLEAVLDYFD